MKKVIIVVCIILAAYLALDSAYYRLGWYIDLHPGDEVETSFKVDGDIIAYDYNSLSGGEPDWREFEIRGVDMGSGIPAKWSTEFAIKEDTYLRWFKEIQDMGANTIRVYTTQNEDFYNAFYKYNKDNDNPLFLIQGVWVNDYVQNSRLDGYSNEFYDRFKRDTRIALDVVHGNKKLTKSSLESGGYGSYYHDVSKWVLGYILGVEWEDVTVEYTNEKWADNEKYNSYKGKYFYTADEATPFEAMLARVGDYAVQYETDRYKTCKPLAFSNWPTTDPFDYPEDVATFYMKFACVDVEHIKTTDAFLSGQFASYHIYPYYPDYLHYCSDWSFIGDITQEEFTEDGVLNTYRAYLTAIADHHTMPVVISEYGVSTSRGMARQDYNTGRNQGHMTEQNQGEALQMCYEDIMSAGCAGSCIFSWQDEWFKRTWNTMHSVNLKRTAFWSDYQTNEQFFGLLTFDPGRKKSVCYVDGDVSEWSDDDIISKQDGYTLSLRYDEKFVYLRVNKRDFDIDSDKVYIPVDVTPKTGTNYARDYGLKFSRNADFLLCIDGKDNSALYVQKRYDAFRSTFSRYALGFNTYIKVNIPEKDIPEFAPVRLILETTSLPKEGTKQDGKAEYYETGRLQYGNANPDSRNFDSLSDFCSEGDDLEIRIPWQMLNFSDPSRCEIHDDYFEHYGIHYIAIDSFYFGAGGREKETDGKRISLAKVPLNGWGNKATSHERLKSSYYAVQAMWKDQPFWSEQEINS